MRLSIVEDEAMEKIHIVVFTLSILITLSLQLYIALKFVIPVPLPYEVK